VKDERKERDDRAVEEPGTATGDATIGGGGGGSSKTTKLMKFKLMAQ
jgi:hypothetical protein